VGNLPASEQASHGWILGCQQDTVLPKHRKRRHLRSMLKDDILKHLLKGRPWLPNAAKIRKKTNIWKQLQELKLKISLDSKYNCNRRNVARVKKKNGSEQAPVLIKVLAEI
jgi:hypothetical protein